MKRIAREWSGIVVATATLLILAIRVSASQPFNDCAATFTPNAQWGFALPDVGCPSGQMCDAEGAVGTCVAVGVPGNQPGLSLPVSADEWRYYGSQGWVYITTRDPGYTTVSGCVCKHGDEYYVSPCCALWREDSFGSGGKWYTTGSCEAPVCSTEGGTCEPIGDPEDLDDGEVKASCE